MRQPMMTGKNRLHCPTVSEPEKQPEKGCAMKTGCSLAAAIALVLAAHPAAAAAAGADRYPEKPIRIVVGFTPGGGPDITARYIALKLGESWKQPVVVDNRLGAGGTIAAKTVASANADGYTLLSVSSAHAVAPAIYNNLPYDTLRDFTGITLTASGPTLLIVSPAINVKSAVI